MRGDGKGCDRAAVGHDLDSNVAVAAGGGARQRDGALGRRVHNGVGDEADNQHRNQKHAAACADNIQQLFVFLHVFLP